MDPQIKQRFTEDHLREAMDRFGIAAGNIKPLDGFESFIYEFSRPDGEYILRIGHSERRSEAMIRGEVDWINHLARGGAAVARAIESARGNLVEGIDDGHGSQFLATAFVKAEGQEPRREMGTPRLIQTWGQAIGRMHALTKQYRPSGPNCIRPHWDDPEINSLPDILPPEDAQAREHARNLIDYLHRLPIEPESYGLIHQDAHMGNFFVASEDTITLFDFDDCCYSWFANDIAIVLFYAVMWEEDKAAYTRYFLDNFMAGYRRENQLDPVWLREIPPFLKLREIDLYAVILKDFGEEYVNHPWCAGYMRGRRERVCENLPYIEDFDFDLYAEQYRACVMEGKG